MIGPIPTTGTKSEVSLHLVLVSHHYITGLRVLRLPCIFSLSLTIGLAAPLHYLVTIVQYPKVSLSLLFLAVLFIVMDPEHQ